MLNKLRVLMISKRMPTKWINRVSFLYLMTKRKGANLW